MPTKLLTRCLNIGNCEKANSMALIEIKESDEFICPECGKTVVAANSPNNKSGIFQKKPLVISLAVAAFLGILYAFSLNKPKDTVPGSSLSSLLPSEDKLILSISGSNTIGSKLMPALVSEYFKTKECNNIQIKKLEAELVNVTCNLNGKNLIASISSRGSGTGFKALANNSAEIAMSSRKVKAAEIAILASKGNITSPSNEHVIALDGIAIIVSPNNLLPKLSVPQIKDIFSGRLKSFNLVDGPERSINLYRRDDKSGTFDSFEALVMDKQPISKSAKAFEDSKILSSSVSTDNDAIGFVGNAFIGDARAVPVGSPGQIALIPNRFTIQTEDYPLTRRLYLYTLAESTNLEAVRFINFVVSTKGQKVVEINNFVPLSIIAKSFMPSTASSAGYKNSTLNAQRLSTNFRFESGSNKLDNRSISDLDRVTEYLISTSTSPEKLILIGFTDNTGDAALNVMLSKERAQAVASTLKSRGISTNKLYGFGSENPVASNQSSAGQDKNRRVEVWVQK